MRQPVFEISRNATGRSYKAVMFIMVSLFIARLPALAGEQRPCSEPAVFQMATVNSIVLPYRYVGENPTRELDQAGREISALVHFEILLSLLKYGSVGGTNLVAEPGKICDVGEVIEEVTRRHGPSSLLPGRMLVVTWGRLFEQGNQLYVQSYVRFVQGGVNGPEAEVITVTLHADGTTLNLVAALPTQSIAFPPRRIGKSDLERVREEFSRTMIVRPTPDVNAEGRSIDFEPGRRFPYGVTRVQGDWMWIEPMAGGPSGWVHARTGSGQDPAEWSLQRWLPELAYIDAIAGFVRLRARDGMSLVQVSRVRDAIDGGFHRFEQAIPEQDAPSVYGLARAVQGFVAMNYDTDTGGKAKAAKMFAEARSLMPEYAPARNLAAVTNPLRTEGKIDSDSAARLGRELVGALALDPNNIIVLNNLEGLYALFLARPALNPFSSQDLSHRIAIVKDVREKAIYSR